MYQSIDEVLYQYQHSNVTYDNDSIFPNRFVYPKQYFDSVLDKYLYNMDLYTALYPVHAFWRCTGIGAYSLRRGKQTSRYVVLKSDKVIAATAITIAITFNILNVSYGVSSDDVFDISDMLKRSSYNAATLSYVLTMQHYKKHVITSIENLILANDEIQKFAQTRNYYHKTRSQVMIISLLLFSVFVAAFSIDFFYEDPVANHPLLHLIYYHTNYVLTVSALAMLLFFLNELKRLFKIVNDYLKNDIHKLCLLRHGKLMDSLEGAKNRIIEIEKIHRLLRSTSKTVNKIFETIIFGKVAATSFFILLVVFKFASNKIVPIKYYRGIYTVWSMIHLLEVAAVIKFFKAVQTEVSQISF